MSKSIVIGMLAAFPMFAGTIGYPEVKDSTHFSVAVNGQSVTLTKGQARALRARLTAGSALIKDSNAVAKKAAMTDAREKINAAFEDKAE